jgi:hypothetical protein
MNDETFTVTMMTSMNPTDPLPFAIDLRVESNTQWDFLKFICDIIETGQLARGDFLIVDNSSVHSGSDAFPVLMQVLEAAGVSLIFLPKYSPELNPCEEIFALVKHHLRCWRGKAHFWLEIIHAFAQVPFMKVFKFYENAILF